MRKAISVDEETYKLIIKKRGQLEYSDGIQRSIAGTIDEVFKSSLSSFKESR